MLKLKPKSWELTLVWSGRRKAKQITIALDEKQTAKIAHSLGHDINQLINDKATIEITPAHFVMLFNAQ